MPSSACAGRWRREWAPSPGSRAAVPTCANGNLGRMTGRIRVALLYGGRSAEHDVSRVSAVAVLEALDPARYEVVPIGITRDGTWLLGTPEDLPALDADVVAELTGGLRIAGEEVVPSV